MKMMSSYEGNKMIIIKKDGLTYIVSANLFTCLFLYLYEVKQQLLTYLQVTSEECCTLGLWHHCDLLEGEQVMDMDIILWKK